MNASISTRAPSTPLTLWLVLACLLTLQARAQSDVPEPGNVLYNQTTNLSTFVLESHDFTDPALTEFDQQGADDFIVPEGQAWIVDEVRMFGPNFFGVSPLGANVFLYPDEEGLPGDATACEYVNIPVHYLSFGLFVSLPEPCVLGAGTWWLSVQGVGTTPDPANGGVQAWGEVKDARNNPGLWREVNNGRGTGCVDWTPIHTCLPPLPGSGDDFSFLVVGTVEGEQPPPPGDSFCVSGAFGGFRFAFTAASTPVDDGLFLLGTADLGSGRPWAALGNIPADAETFEGLTANPEPFNADPNCEAFPDAMWFRDFEMISPGTFSGRIETFCVIPQEGGFIEDVTLTMEAGACAPSTAVERLSSEVPDAFRLAQNYPNPFNPTTSTPFALAEAAEVRLAVFDVLGRKVTTLVAGWMEPGTYTADWEGMNDAGVAVSGGVYVYRLTAGASTATRAMTLVR